MITSFTLEELVSFNKAEAAHCMHVAKLARDIGLFLVKKKILPEKVIPLLVAAAKLHDIGFEIDPSQHSKISAQIIKKACIRGFSKLQKNIIAHVVSLHSRNWQEIFQDPQLLKLPYRDLILKLGAIIRVADGLDNGHIQDARIKGMKFKDGKLLVNVINNGYWKNAQKAQGKADLWHRVFPFAIVFKGHHHSKIIPYKGVIGRNDKFIDCLLYTSPSPRDS